MMRGASKGFAFVLVSFIPLVMHAGCDSAEPGDDELDGPVASVAEAQMVCKAQGMVSDVCQPTACKAACPEAFKCVYGAIDDTCWYQLTGFVCLGPDGGVPTVSCDYIIDGKVKNGPQCARYKHQIVACY